MHLVAFIILLKTIIRAVLDRHSIKSIHYNQIKYSYLDHPLTLTLFIVGGRPPRPPQLTITLALLGGDPPAADPPDVAATSAICSTNLRAKSEQQAIVSDSI